MNAPLRLDIDGFMAWAASREARYELVRGRPVLQAQVSRAHMRITTNLLRLLGDVLPPEQWDVSLADFPLRTGPDSVRLPDFMIEPRAEDADPRHAVAPILLFEVLSPTTMHVDFNEKLHEYAALPSVLAYVVLAQDAARAWVCRRDDQGVWSAAPDILEDSAVVTLTPPGPELALAEIHRGVL